MVAAPKVAGLLIMYLIFYIPAIISFVLFIILALKGIKALNIYIKKNQSHID